MTPKSDIRIERRALGDLLPFSRNARSHSDPVEVVRISADIRTNFTIMDKHGLTLKLNELGPHITDGELEQIEQAVASRLTKATWLMLCGSIPPGVCPIFIAS